MPKAKLPDPIDESIDQLTHGEIDQRVRAARALGEIGDARALQALRDRMRIVGSEHAALIAAVGKLKRRLGVR